MKLQVRFDGPPGPVSGHFIEVEDEAGRSICAGEWVQDGEFWLLIIDTDRLEPLPQVLVDNLDKFYHDIREARE